MSGRNERSQTRGIGTWRKRRYWLERKGNNGKGKEEKRGKKIGKKNTRMKDERTHESWLK